MEGAIIGQAIGTAVGDRALHRADLRAASSSGFDFGELGRSSSAARSGPDRLLDVGHPERRRRSSSPGSSSHKDVGLYNLASRTGFVVAFLPQGFRMALRPIRKTAVFGAYREEYGMAVANGQLLAYFVLITLTAVLAMVLGGEILIQIGGPRVRVRRAARSR